MNIFYTNSDPIKCAKEHCYRHVVKMITEYNQMLSTAHHILDGEDAPKNIYKSTHINHPSSKWVRQSVRHYNWLVTCALELNHLFVKKSGKHHAGFYVLERLLLAPKNMPNNGFLNPPVCAPDEFVEIGRYDGTEKAYQEYMKFKFNDWATRDRPLKVEFVCEVPEWMGG